MGKRDPEALHDHWRRSPIRDRVESSTHSEIRVTRSKRDHLAIDEHLRIASYRCEVFIRIQMAVRSHRLAREEVEDA